MLLCVKMYCLWQTGQLAYADGYFQAGYIILQAIIFSPTVIASIILIGIFALTLLLFGRPCLCGIFLEKSHKEWFHLEPHPFASKMGKMVQRSCSSTSIFTFFATCSHLPSRVAFILGNGKYYHLWSSALWFIVLGGKPESNKTELADGLQRTSVRFLHPRIKSEKKKTTAFKLSW